MSSSRRVFIKNTTSALALSGLSGACFQSFKQFTIDRNKAINPWIEISKEAYLHNVDVISQMADGKPIMAVLKNNAYGIGDVEVSCILDSHPKVSGIAVVKETRALAIRKSGVKKPILLMGDFDEELGPRLVKSNITLSIHSFESLEKIKQLANRTSQSVSVQLYIDTGLGRMGMPYYEAQQWALEIAKESDLKIDGAFTTLTTPKDFANEQLKRFNDLIKGLRLQGLKVDNLHSAPSYSMLTLTNSHLDMVRPGILLHGSFPLLNSAESEKYKLRPTFKLKARVIRVEKLRKGDCVGFSRFYTANSDEWIATIPIGWADGYDSRSENGAKVLIGTKTYRVINVNASHCNLLLNSKNDVKVGDIATLIGPDHEEITPAGFARSIDGHTYLQINFKESIPKYVYEDFE